MSEAFTGNFVEALKRHQDKSRYEPGEFMGDLIEDIQRNDRRGDIIDHLNKVHAVHRKCNYCGSTVGFMRGRCSCCGAPDNR